jgi:hypothetical protein
MANGSRNMPRPSLYHPSALPHTSRPVPPSSLAVRSVSSPYSLSASPISVKAASLPRPTPKSAS